MTSCPLGTPIAQQFLSVTRAFGRLCQGSPRALGRGIGLVVVLAVLLSVFATRPAAAEPTEVPVDIGFGPAFHMVTGTVQDDQTFHYGMKLSLEGIISKELIKKNEHRIPKKYRKLVANAEEIRYRIILVPDTLYLSPGTEHTQMWGASWRPIAIGIPFVTKPVRFHIGIGVDLSYAYLDSTAFASPTHFLRPGLDARADLEIPFSDSFLISFGWQSFFYVPQGIGDGVFESFESDAGSIWHIGQLYALLHFRFPYTVNL